MTTRAPLLTPEERDRLEHETPDHLVNLIEELKSRLDALSKLVVMYRDFWNDARADTTRAEATVDALRNTIRKAEDCNVHWMQRAERAEAALAEVMALRWDCPSCSATFETPPVAARDTET